MSCDSYIYSVLFPHCDQTVLHAPEECVHCDHYPTLQNVRINNAIPFSGEGGSPDEKNRPRETIDRWGGNRAVKCNHLPLQNRGAEMDDGSFLCGTCKSWVQPESIWEKGMGAMQASPVRAKKKKGCHVCGLKDDAYGICTTCFRQAYCGEVGIVPDQSPDSRYGSSDAAFDYLVKGDEVGCQVNLITGEHYGPCKGSCGSEKDPLQVLSEYLEKEAQRWKTDPRSDFRDGVVSGYRWAKWKLDGAIKNSESD